MMKKRLISIFISLCLIITLLSGISVSGASVTAYTNQYTYIRLAPYWTASVVDTIAAGIRVTIIERDQTYLYVEYSNPTVKRGYIPMQSVDTTSYDWCNHTIYSHGHNKSGASVTVRYGPNSSYDSLGSIDSDEGSNSTKPLLVLGESGDYYFVQYVTNPTATGSTQPLFKRGWVLKLSIQIGSPIQPPLTDLTSSYQYALISNSNNEYLTVVADSSQASGYKLTFASATGNNIQQWKFVKVSYTGQTYYKIYSASYNLCLQIDGAAPIVGNKMILTAPSHPNKAQEFSFSSVISTDPAGSTVRILPRCSGTFLALQKSGTDLCQYRAGESTAQYFRVDPIDNHWENGYDGSDGAHLTYNIFSSAISGNITEDIIDTAASQWNGISSNVSLAKASSNYYDVTVRGADLRNIFGKMLPVLDYTGSNIPADDQLATYNPTDYQLNQDWYRSLVCLNTDTTSKGCMLTFSEYDIQSIVTHELGHALKLRHPHEGTNSSGGYETYRYIYSVMNQGKFSTTNYVSKTPSEYDIRSLQEKWN